MAIEKASKAWADMLNELECGRSQGFVTDANFRTFLDQFAIVPNGHEHQATAIHVATTLPDLDWEKTWLALGATAKQYQEAVSKLELVSDPRYWTAPFLDITRSGKPLLTPNRIGQALREAGSGFKSCSYEDLDANVTENDRDPYLHGPYSRSFLRSIEAQEFGKTSCNEVKEREKGTEFSILLEGLFLEFAFFLTTRGHLDIKHWTVHLGSRYRGRDFPSSGWYPGNSRVGVYRRSAGGQGYIVRARPAVSLPIAARVCEQQSA